MEARARQRAHYLANVTMIDEKVGDILRALDEKGLLENSIVVFTSDHGDTMGDHGQSQKWTMYDDVVRVPLIVWNPGFVPQGRTASQLVQLFDLAPTVLEWAGAPVPAYMEAESLRPFLGDEDPPGGREYVFAELGPDNVLEGVRFMTMVRSRDWKLVHLLGSPEGQLFNLRADPHEERNLWSDRAHADRKRDMIDAMVAWRFESQIRTRSWTAEHR